MNKGEGGATQKFGEPGRRAPFSKKETTQQTSKKVAGPRLMNCNGTCCRIAVADSPTENRRS